jgi:DNA-binding IclR family transcriptional regulator
MPEAIPNSKGEAPQSHTRALLRGLEILRAFSTAEPELTLTELAERLDLNHSTVLRLLDCLRYAGFMECDAPRKVWRLGIASFEVGSIYLATQRMEHLARPYLEALARAQQQTSNLGIRDHFAVVHLAVVHPERPLHYRTHVGARDDLHCTGLGKVLATGLSTTELDQLIAAGLHARTPKTITDGDQFRTHLEQVRAQGYALDDEEGLIGLRCVAAPITDRSGVLRAALSISGPAAEFTADQLQDSIQAVQQAAENLSRSLLGLDS